MIPRKIGGDGIYLNLLGMIVPNKQDLAVYSFPVDAVIEATQFPLKATLISSAVIRFAGSQLVNTLRE